MPTRPNVGKDVGDIIKKKHKIFERSKWSKFRGVLKIINIKAT